MAQDQLFIFFLALVLQNLIGLSPTALYSRSDHSIILWYIWQSVDISRFTQKLHYLTLAFLWELWERYFFYCCDGWLISLALKCFWYKMIAVLLYIFKHEDLISYYPCDIRGANCTLYSNDRQSIWVILGRYIDYLPSKCLQKHVLSFFVVPLSIKVQWQEELLIQVM